MVLWLGRGRTTGMCTSCVVYFLVFEFYIRNNIAFVIREKKSIKNKKREDSQNKNTGAVNALKIVVLENMTLSRCDYRNNRWLDCPGNNEIVVSPLRSPSPQAHHTWEPGFLPLLWGCCVFTDTVPWSCMTSFHALSHRFINPCL